MSTGRRVRLLAAAGAILWAPPAALAQPETGVVPTGDLPAGALQLAATLPAILGAGELTPAMRTLFDLPPVRWQARERVLATGRVVREEIIRRDGRFAVGRVTATDLTELLPVPWTPR